MVLLQRSYTFPRMQMGPNIFQGGGVQLCDFPVCGGGGGSGPLSMSNCNLGLF